MSLFHLGKEANLLAYLPDRSIGRCAEGLAALAALSAGDRDAWLADTAALAVSPAPEDLSALHPSWISEAIRTEPLPLIRAIVACLPDPARATVEAVLPPPDQDETVMASTDLPPPVLLDLARLVFLPLEPLCAPPVGPLATELRALPFDQLILRVMGLGAELVGRSLHGAPSNLRAKLMATVGEPWATVMARAFGETPSPEARALAIRHAGISPPSTAARPEDRLFHVGLSRLREDLEGEGGEGLFILAGRLPYALGRPWLGEAWRGW